MHNVLSTRFPAGQTGCPALSASVTQPTFASPPPSRFPRTRRRRLGSLVAGLAAALLPACAEMNEPPRACLLAAINERAVIRARNYMRHDVEAHLLAIWFQDSRHVALVVKGDHDWFAWDDAYGGRPLFMRGQTAHLPNPITAARAAFPRKNVELAWWAD